MSTNAKIPIWLSTENQNIDTKKPKSPIIKLDDFKFNLLGMKLIKEYCDGIKFETKLEEIEATIGEEMANAFISEIERYTGQAIDQAVENELAKEINAAISYAVQQGVSEAAAAAAIEETVAIICDATFSAVKAMFSSTPGEKGLKLVIVRVGEYFPW